jgi:hypothetical protein
MAVDPQGAATLYLFLFNAARLMIGGGRNSNALRLEDRAASRSFAFSKLVIVSIQRGRAGVANPLENVGRGIRFIHPKPNVRR